MTWRRRDEELAARLAARLDGGARGPGAGATGEPRGDQPGGDELAALEDIALRLRSAAGPDDADRAPGDVRRTVLGRLAGASVRRRRVRLAGAVLAVTASIAMLTGTVAIGPAAVLDVVGSAIDSAIAIVRSRLDAAPAPDPVSPAPVPTPGVDDSPGDLDRPSPAPASTASPTPTPAARPAEPGPTVPPTALPRPPATPAPTAPPPSPAPTDEPGPPSVLPSLPPPPDQSPPLPTRSPGPP